MPSQTRSHFYTSGTRQQAEVLVRHLGDIEQVADDVLADAGVFYHSRADFGTYPFPERAYKDDLTLPAGSYRALRIILEEATEKTSGVCISAMLCGQRFRTTVKRHRAGCTKMRKQSG